MQSTKKLTLSRRVYARLLYLFPQEHREEYGPSMQQLFSDQLHEAEGAGGKSVFALWLRTLRDLGVSAVKEQFSSPHLTAGLFEAVPNKPLPWKGVALVLVPGLVFFIAQLGQLSGQDWFYLMARRAGYFFILPVLLVWIWQRKFPIWGLVPLGLLFNTLWEVAYRAYSGQYSLTHPQWFGWLEWGTPTSDIVRVAAAAIVVVAILMLLIVLARRRKLPRSAWVWLAAYVLLSAAYPLANYWEWKVTGYAMEGWRFFYDIGPGILYQSVGLLLLILFGAFFAERHGRLTMLLMMGYLLPAVLYGRFANVWNTLPDAVVNGYLLLISITVLVYRFLIAFAAPVWVVRSAAPKAQRRASLITLLICVGLQAAMSLGVGVFMTLNYQFTGFIWLDWYITVAPELVAAAGIGFASVLYGSAKAALAASAPEPVAALKYEEG